MKSNNIIIALCILVACGFNSCKKYAGEGGRASIKGKLYAVNLTNSLILATDSGYIAGENVYISYGTNTNIDDKTETSAGGEFQFPYLQKGDYTIFAISKKLNGTNKLDTVVVKKVSLTDRNQVADIGDLRIYVNKN